MILFILHTHFMQRIKDFASKPFFGGKTKITSDLVGIFFDCFDDLLIQGACFSRMVYCLR